MLYALDRDGKSAFTFQGHRLGFGEYGIGPRSEWDPWTQVVIYRTITDESYVVHICRMTRLRRVPDTHEVVTYRTAEHLRAALLYDEIDAILVEASRMALANAAVKDPSLDDASDRRAA